VVSTEREESGEFGDSVFVDLERDGLSIELEYYEHGQLVGYAVDEASSGEEDLDTEPYFSAPESTADLARSAFASEVWLG